ncbi:VC0807 family protein [Streptomyces sp. NPDC048254]|uniref:VC0807 family protein n=1 Tax=Streptomyces sp. NPDC048254 TaxID=3365525 RepID=UPI00371CA77C
MEPSRTHRTGRLARLTRLALDLGVASFVYYGCVLAGLDTPPALLTASAAAAVWLGATTLYDRRADALALAMLLMYGLSAVLAALTAEPRLLLLRDPLASGLAGLVFLVSGLRGTPATGYLADRLHGHPPGDVRLRRVHRTQTLVLGAGITAESLARALLVCTLPVATAAAVTPPLEYAVLVPLAAWTVLWRRRILSGTAPGSPPRPGTVAPSTGGAHQGPRPAPR